MKEKDEGQRRIYRSLRQWQKLTGLEDFGAYLAGMLEMDMFFLNEDRHTNNIALIYRHADRSYRLCPYFDMGLSLCADTREEYPLHLDMETCRKRVKAKPFRLHMNRCRRHRGTAVRSGRGCGQRSWTRRCHTPICLKYRDYS